MISTETRQRRLKHIDNALSTMRSAGYSIDQDAIALVWKAAAGEATQAEIEAWTQRMAESIVDIPSNLDVSHRLATMVAHITSDIQRCQRQFASLPVIN